MNARILIADDEKLERRALSLILGSMKGHDITLVEAANGRQAVEMARAVPLDLALLDVRMPGMDGIAAAREIRAFSPDTRIIFITAFDSFDYAREALRLNVDEYLVKPADKESVRETVSRVLIKLDEERREAARRQQTREERERALDLLERELRAAIQRNALVGNRFDAFLGLRGLAGRDRFVAALKPLSDDCREDVAFANARRLAALAESLLRDDGWFGVAVADCCEVRIIAANEVAGREKLQELLLSLIELARQELGLRVVVGAAPALPADGPELFAPAQDAAALACAASPLVILVPEGGEVPIEHENRSEISAATVERAISFIKAHLAENFTLADAASWARCSSFYLSRLFKVHCGETFVRYIAKQRVEAAKALLRTGDYSVKEVAALVGFHDQAYFTKIFKRLTGRLPVDYRLNPL